MNAVSEQEYKAKVYYEGRNVFKAAYFETLEEAESAARESLGLGGRIVETLGRGSA